MLRISDHNDIRPRKRKTKQKNEHRLKSPTPTSVCVRCKARTALRDMSGGDTGKGEVSVHQWPFLWRLKFADEGRRLCHSGIPGQPQCQEQRSPLSLRPEELTAQDAGLTHPGPGSTPRAGHPAGLHGGPASPCRWLARPPDALPACDTGVRPGSPPVHWAEPLLQPPTGNSTYWP